MKYEGSGIMLNIDRIVRMFFVEHLNQTELAHQGYTTFDISLRTLEDSPWQHYDLTAERNLDTNSWRIMVRDRAWKPPVIQAQATISTKLLPGKSEPDFTVE